MPEAAYDGRFVHFVVLFNVDEDYFECHEVMEELWLEEGRNLLYQGLLQVAVGLHHWRNDNRSGAVKLFTAALEKLAGYADVELGLDLGRLKSDTRLALAALTAYRAAEAEAGRTGAGRPKPPPFQPYRIAVLDPVLAALADELAAVPLEERLHGEED
ncbi:MAG TPA: DUF309 domain-containing protein [Paenibacillus sp.]|uniref:DUF309 domain-containing protein n=1 Tax=Paenibacillus sp. TaxID=58172 RepID=UPI0028D41C4E|nr:DUF309 domain-containing protein [Paenibacillus sp.]HUC93518.1 DUF309 domain-containing protein [Paenibacillus sp.]